MSKIIEASEWACDRVEPWVECGELLLPKASFKAALYGLRVAVMYECPVSGRPFYSITDEHGEMLVHDAWHDADAFEFTKIVCETNLRARRQLPNVLRTFLCDLLCDRKPPKRKGTRPRNWLEKYFIYTLVKEVSYRFELELTRNDTSPPHSAADILSDALSVCGRPTSFNEVKSLISSRDHATFRSQVTEYERACDERSEIDKLVAQMAVQFKAREGVALPRRLSMLELAMGHE